MRARIAGVSQQALQRLRVFAAAGGAAVAPLQRLKHLPDQIPGFFLRIGGDMQPDQAVCPILHIQAVLFIFHTVILKFIHRIIIV